MQKYLLTIKDEFGLEEKNNNTLYGYCGNYEVTIWSTINSSEGIVVFLNFFADEVKKQEIIREFINFEGKAFAGGMANITGVRLNLNGMTAGGAAKKLVLKLRHVITMLHDQGIPGKGVCPVCGEELVESEKIQVNDCYVTVDPKCANDFRSASQIQNKEFEEAPGNYLKGFFGSLIGAVVGAVVWFVLYYFVGIVSAWLGLLTVMLSDFLYVKFEGKKDKFRVLISAVTVLVMFELVCFMIYGLVGSALAYEAGSNLSGIQYVLQDAELKGGFIYDMLMNLVYTGIGVAIQASIINKKNKQEKLRVK